MEDDTFTLPQTPKDDIIDRATIEQMICDSEDPMIEALLAVLWNTGHRISEIAGEKGLKRSDVWIDDKWIYFRFSVLKRKDGFIHTIKVPMKAAFTSYIISWIDTIDASDLVFDISRQYVDIKLKRLNKNVHAHMFRHTLATRMAEKGATKWEMDAWFGWSGWDTASIYVQKGTAMIENMANKLIE
jgi:site-specific recombinase XerD